MSNAEDIEATLRQLERQRCELLMNGDADGLAKLLADDLVHIHLNGLIDDKAGYLLGVRDKFTFETVSRGPITIRVFGDVAVMTGPLTQTLIIRQSGRAIDVKAMSSQVWNRLGDGYVLNTCHNAPVTAP
jgi:ketosteroid isomerase-like protein